MCKISLSLPFLIQITNFDEKQSTWW
uniref:Uncharacterized protein n=1 Tax=Anguilla anguilla TaxID=7936 RepID=A0A0E9W5A7_ANGAN